MTVQTIMEITMNRVPVAMTAKYNSFIQLKHLPMNEKSGKYSEMQGTLLT